MKNTGKNRDGSRILRLCLCAVSGFLFSLPLVFEKAFILAWIAPVPVLFAEFYCISQEKHPFGSAWGRGVLFFWCSYFVAFSWFCSIYPIDYLGYGKWDAILVIVMAMTLLPLLQAVFSALIFVFIAAVRRSGAIERAGFAVFPAVAFLWSISEWLQTLTFAGVPWARVAVGQAEVRPLIQSASLFGSYFVTFIVILCACILCRSAKAMTERKARRALLSLAAAFAVFFANYLYGTVRIAGEHYEGESVKIAALQGNILFEEKIADKEDYIKVLYRDLTVEAARDGAELILWPETAIPYNYEPGGEYEEYIKSVRKGADADIIATFFKYEDGDLKNIVFPVTEDGVSEKYYAKRHLVPFGEYVPYENVIDVICPPLARFAAIDAPLSPGDRAEVFTVPEGRVSALVCFDSIFEKLCLEGVREGSQLILVSTNDSWFAGSPALRQHNKQAVLRAVECGRYAVRAANTGISSVISPTGEVIASLGDGKRGYITADVKMISDMTLYARVGNIIVPAGTVYVCSILAYSLMRKKKWNL